MANPTKLQKINAFNAKNAPQVPNITPLSPKQQQQLAPNAKNLKNAQQQVVQKQGAINSPVPGQQQQQQQPPMTNAQIIQMKALQNRQVRDQQKAQLEAAKQAEEEAADQVAKIGMVTDDATQVAGAVTRPGIQWLSRLPTPGGIATMLLILGFFLLAVFPVNPDGDTRLKLLWLTLTGKTSLKYNAPPNAPSTPSATNNIKTPPQTGGTKLPMHSGPDSSGNGHITPISTYDLGNIDIFGVMGFGN